MALSVFYPADITRALLAAKQASAAALLATGGDGPYTQGYQAGHRAALTTIALAFGLLQPDSLREDFQSPLAVLTAITSDRGFNWGNGRE